MNSQTTNRVCLAWEPSPSPDIAGYRLYMGTNSGLYPTWRDVGNITNSCVTNVAEGVVHYFVVTSRDPSGLESDPSYEVSCSIPVGGRIPTIYPIPDQTILENRSLGPINVTIGDDATPPQNLVLTATSTNQVLVPNSGITIGGSGANRTVAARPSTNAFGVSLITLQVKDADNGFSTISFLLTVDPSGTLVKPNPPNNLHLESSSP